MAPVAGLGSKRPSQYWSDLKTQLADSEGFIELYGNIVQLKMPTPDGKMRETGEGLGKAAGRTGRQLGNKRLNAGNYLPIGLFEDSGNTHGVGHQPGAVGINEIGVPQDWDG